MTLAQEVYTDFLREVVEPHVFSDAERGRAAGPLAEAQAAAVASRKRIDNRPPFLVTISGKGGWHAETEKAKRYGAFANVTLLDHLMSVVRGSMQFAAVDLAHHGLPETGLQARLATVAAVAFLHDADKMEGLSRHDEVSEEQMAVLMQRYGIDAFLKARGVTIHPAQMQALVDAAETSRDGRVRPGKAVAPREAKHDCTYVRLADRLDGKFLKQRRDPDKPEEKLGVEAVLDELARYDQLDSPALKAGWRAIEIRDPHTPFLLDALQAGLSAAAMEKQGMPPLIETHHDGRLVVIIPEVGSAAVIDEALSGVTRQLGAAIRVETTNRGKVDLLDAPGTVDQLRSSVNAMMARDREMILRIGIDLLRAQRDDIDRFLRPGGLLPKLPELATYPGRLVPLWIGTIEMDEADRAALIDAASLNAVLSCDDPSAKLGVPSAAARQAELVELLTRHGLLTAWPVWFESAAPDSQRALLAALAAGAARHNGALEEALFGPEGLAALWLEGRGDRPGLNRKIDASGAKLATAVRRHYEALLSKRLVLADNEADDGRCHFTNAPVQRIARIDGKTGLYGVNVSAFSGREGRPESARSAYAETLVAPVAEAEHRLRQIEFERSGRSSATRKTPVRITSPTAAGLFGALVYQRSNDAQEFAMSDVLRQKLDEGKLVFDEGAAFESRLRVARYEEMPTRLVSSGTEPGQLGFVAMVLEATRRTGRPIHVFRGLPHVRPEFVAFDMLPPAIALMLEPFGGTGFRLEQIPDVLSLLRGVESIAGATGFGVELALRVADPATRFGAACDALDRAERRIAAGETSPAFGQIKRFTTQLLGEDILKTDVDRALVNFGEAMALVQRAPIRSDGGNVAELGLRTALDTVETLERMDQTHDDSLMNGVAREIKKLLERRQLFARNEIRGGRSVDDALESAARLFVAQVWHGAFKGTAPSSRNRRVAFATYGFAFENSARKRRNELAGSSDGASAAADDPAIA